VFSKKLVEGEEVSRRQRRLPPASEFDDAPALIVGGGGVMPLLSVRAAPSFWPLLPAGVLPEAERCAVYQF